MELFYQKKKMAHGVSIQEDKDIVGVDRFSTDTGYSKANLCSNKEPIRELR